MAATRFLLAAGFVLLALTSSVSAVIAPSSSSVALLKEASFNSATAYANIKKALPMAKEVSLALTAADLKGMTALVLNARPGVEAVLNASVTAKASAGFYKAVGDWVRKGNTLVLVNGAVGGFKPVIEKFMKKSQACVGVQLAANRTTKFTLRYRQDPYTALAATWVTNSTEVPAGLQCQKGSGRPVMTSANTNGVSSIHQFAAGQGTIVFLAASFEGATVKTIFTDALYAAIANTPIPTPSPTPSPKASPSPTPTPSPTPSPKASPSPSPSPKASPSPSPTPSPKASPSPSPTPSPKASPSPSPSPKASPSPTPSPKASPSPTPSPKASPSPSPSPSTSPKVSPTPSPAGTAPKPAPTPSPSPTKKNKPPPPEDAPPPAEMPPPMEDSAPPPPKKKTG
ncbi:hypothetical protein CHLRE_10g463350v5 [Chlamydomonas reinhardtii]|uniref:Uncharacterized protein n=1 Tax=Chlamydomonas reinhardtii TaxID=3055 RepID=A8I1E4_CHLRE|nr:uncharacterized protein CHLRE_10g463350v5 [Chlamydomonas reinhardtii]PNW78074.1 hypothetical protein CHLRE_10g463350v5 [Chlamydomonas reinhardtii]|eukprot:XP_001698611.1 hydroxyproline-rich cell wall protein [Chlamydomonas reinhardtii]